MMVKDNDNRNNNKGGPDTKMFHKWLQGKDTLLTQHSVRKNMYARC